MHLYLCVLVCLSIGMANCLLPGGIRRMTDEEIQNDEILLTGVEFAVDKYNSDTNSRLIATNVISATVQVVAGFKYNALIELRPRLCVQDPKTKIATCPLRMNLPTKCSFTFLYQSWVPQKYSMLSTKCLRA
uniref:Cystatin J n=1 Tax=Cyanea capillata TaxID=27804 RepID=CYT_CYACP|nr:RecName: Full=Cystatin J; Flags: Precursor [Cyanea capillata]AAO38706.1 cystatin [Cyanea capillata]